MSNTSPSLFRIQAILSQPSGPSLLEWTITMVFSRYQGNPSIYIKQYFLSVCLFVCVLSSRHGFVFQVRDVWFSLKGFKFSGVGVTVLKKKSLLPNRKWNSQKHQNSGSFTLKTKVLNRI